MMSQALCKASKEVCEIAVEKMNGRAKLIRKDRTVGEQSRTATFVSAETNEPLSKELTS